VTESDQHSGRHVGPLTLLVVWLVLVGDAAANFGLFHVKLGSLQLPVALGLATLNFVLLLWFFMHLAEVRGTRRFALPVGVLYLLLLLALTLLDVTTRFPPARPNGLASSQPEAGASPAGSETNRTEPGPTRAP